MERKVRSVKMVPAFAVRFVGLLVLIVFGLAITIAHRPRWNYRTTYA